MAAAHDLLVTENWESADLRETLAAALDPFGSDVRGRFQLEGPPVQITAKAALALSMALHELCTNAAKYGALTTAEGQVAIRWRLATGEEGGRLQLSWTERGGPPVTPPEHAGFGTRLIRTALASELGATAELTFAEAGVEFVLDADAALVLATAPRARNRRLTQSAYGQARRSAPRRRSGGAEQGLVPGAEHPGLLAGHDHAAPPP